MLVVQSYWNVQLQKVVQKDLVFIVQSIIDVLRRSSEVSRSNEQVDLFKKIVNIIELWLVFIVGTSDYFFHLKDSD